MDPNQYAPVPSNNYDFIMDPQKPPKPKLFGGGGGGGSFITKIALIVGGALVIIVVLAVLTNIFFGNKTNIENFVALAQREQEIVRLSGLGKTATSQAIKNAVTNTELTLISHQQTWMAFLDKRGREVKKEELNLKKDSDIDKKLQIAEQTSTFDDTYTDVMREQLKDYAAELKTTFNGSSGQQQREILSNHYGEVDLLLKQWPQ